MYKHDSYNILFLSEPCIFCAETAPIPDIFYSGPKIMVLRRPHLILLVYFPFIPHQFKKSKYAIAYQYSEIIRSLMLLLENSLVFKDSFFTILN